MELVNTIKRAPRWAWVTAAGIGLGAAGIKLWTNRNKPDSTAVADEVLDPSLPYPVPTSTGNPVATIVPPVIIGQQSGDNGMGLVSSLHDAYISGVGNLIQSYQDVWGPVQTAQMALLGGHAQTIQDLAIAGAAPSSATPMPEVLQPFAAPVAAAPIALPAPAPAQRPSTPASPCGTCKAPYPYCNEANKKCYTVACASGNGDRRKGRWHLYADARHNTWMGPTC